MGRTIGQLFKRWVSAAVGLGWSPGEYTGDGEVAGLCAMKVEPWQARVLTTVQSGETSPAYVWESYHVNSKSVVLRKN